MGRTDALLEVSVTHSGSGAGIVLVPLSLLVPLLNPRVPLSLSVNLNFGLLRLGRTVNWALTSPSQLLVNVSTNTSAILK